MIKIFNTFFKKKCFLKPIDFNKIKISVCGITVNDLCHIGHARTFIVFDVIIRYLIYKGYSINYLRNITDIDDNIIIRSLKNSESIFDYTKRIIKYMYKDLDYINILRPNIEPKVSIYINYIIKLIKIIIKNGYAYIAKNGDVKFNINNIKNKYCILSKNILFKLYINNINELDFVLWKKNNFLCEPQWVSPWGLGRPGWHIECTAINNILLGKLDIHGGGRDLIFPHHENEIIQFISAFNNIKYVKYWIHVGLIYNKKKMSKTLGNIIYLKNILKKYDIEVIKYYFLSTHYRKNICFMEKNINKSKNAIEYFYLVINGINIIYKPIGGDKYINKFYLALEDDINIPEVFYIFNNIAQKINIIKKNNIHLVTGMVSTFRYLGKILGFFNIKKIKKYIKYFKILIYERKLARLIGNWKKSDFIRKKINKKGIILYDKILFTYYMHPASLA